MPVLDDRFDPDAHQDSVVFALSRVRSTRTPQALAAVVVAALGGLVAIGALDRQPASTPTALGPTNGPAVNVPADASPKATPKGRTEQRSNRFTDDPIATTFDLDVRPAGSHLFIHGDVFSLAVVRVSVTLEDSAGHIAATKAVDVPGGSTAFLLGAVPRFDVHFFLPDEVRADGFVVSATALDAAGRKLATMQQHIARAEVSM